MLTRRSPARKSFISAPLIGTVAFLATVVFIVNLQNVEAQGSLRIANDAYHNRIASVLEQHRSDLSSIFREGLSRTIAFYLLNQGWDEFTWTNNPNGAYNEYDSAVSIRSSSLDGDISGEPANGRVSLKELKYGKCQSIKALTSDVICSIPQVDDLSSVSGDARYKYGLPQWMSKFVIDQGLFVFEGITFKTSNVPQVEVFTPSERVDDVGAEQAIQDYNGYCRALLQGSVFDCENYAGSDLGDNDEEKFKCKDPDTGEAIKGCEDGTFFVKVNVENVIPVGGRLFEVYPKLPRVEASEGANVVRSSGIGEKNFYLPINLRIFKYFEETFKVYEKLAYGGSETNQNEDNGVEGVADGHCGGKGQGHGSKCRDATDYSDDGYKVNPPYNGINKEVANQVMRIFFDKVFKPACTSPDFFRGPDQANVDLRFCPNTPTYTCTDVLTDGKKCGELDLTADSSMIGDTFVTGEVGCSESGASPGVKDEKCAYYQNLPINKFVLVDRTPRFRIDPADPIAFQWKVNICHEIPGRGCVY